MSAANFHPRSSGKLAGFSLAEVALALGVAAFVLTAILGLTSTAVSVGREGRESVEVGMLFKQIAGQLRIKPFALTQPGNETGFALPALNGVGQTDFFVDSSGSWAGNVSASLPEGAEYAVSVMIFDAQVMDADGLPEPSPAAEGRLAFLRIEISPASAYAAGKTDSPHVYVTEIARLGQ